MQDANPTSRIWKLVGRFMKESQNKAGYSSKPANALKDRYGKHPRTLNRNNSRGTRSTILVMARPSEMVTQLRLTKSAPK